MNDLLAKYGPNMVALEQSIERHAGTAIERRTGTGTKTTAPAPGNAVSAGGETFSQLVLRGMGPQGTSTPPTVDPHREALLEKYSPQEIADAEKVAREFEAVFIAQMLQPMFQDLNTQAPFGGGNSERIWRSLMVDEYGKAMAENGGIGVADAVLREMLKV